MIQPRSKRTLLFRFILELFATCMRFSAYFPLVVFARRAVFVYFTFPDYDSSQKTDNEKETRVIFPADQNIRLLNANRERTVSSARNLCRRTRAELYRLGPSETQTRPQNSRATHLRRIIDRFTCQNSCLLRVLTNVHTLRAVIESNAVQLIGCFQYIYRFDKYLLRYFIIDGHLFRNIKRRSEN